MRRCVSAAIWMVLCGSAALADDAEVRKLVERVARGSASEAREAREKLIDGATEPLLRAIGAIDQRPVEEQRRLRGLLAGISARMGARLLRAGLPAADRVLFDAIEEYNPELVEQIFDEDPRRRLAAVRQIPIERNSGAAVLAASKLEDPIEDVAVAALEVLGSLRDEVTARNLIRFVERTTEDLRGAKYGPAEQELATSLVVFVGQSIQLLAEMKSRAALPAIIRAAEFYPRVEAYEKLAPEGEDVVGFYCDVLSKIGDPGAIPVLRGWLGEKGLCANALVSGGEHQKSALITQTRGDAAMLALLRITGQDPAEYGFQMGPEPRCVMGFVEAAVRDAAHRKLRAWFESRGAAASQPATASSGGE